MLISADIAALKRNMVQAVHDIRRAVDFLASRREIRTGAVGLSGTSLGAIIGSLAFAVEPRLVAGCFSLGGADLAQILWHSSRLAGERESLRRQGLSEARLRDELAEIEPLTYLKSAPARPSYVIGARYDSVVPIGSTEALIHALNGPQVLWLDTGHVGSAFAGRPVLRSIAEFFGAAFGSREFRAPGSLAAPTLRVGFLATEKDGLQVFAGVDLLKSRHNNDAFLSAIFTPKGVRGYGGLKLSKEISIGFAVGPLGVSPGVSWSSVL